MISGYVLPAYSLSVLSGNLDVASQCVGVGVWGQGPNMPEEIRDLIKRPVWVKAFRCKPDLHNNGSLSEFCSTEGRSFTLNCCGQKSHFTLLPLPRESRQLAPSRHPPCWSLPVTDSQSPVSV